MSFELIPVIFGNGEDDDTQGIIAILSDEKVIVADKTYQPGEKVILSGCNIVISHRISVFEEDGGRAIFGTMLPAETGVVIHAKSNFRKLDIIDCCFLFESK